MLFLAQHCGTLVGLSGALLHRLVVRGRAAQGLITIHPTRRFSRCWRRVAALDSIHTVQNGAVRDSQWGGGAFLTCETRKRKHSASQRFRLRVANGTVGRMIRKPHRNAAAVKVMCLPRVWASVQTNRRDFGVRREEIEARATPRTVVEGRRQLVAVGTDAIRCAS